MKYRLGPASWWRRQKKARSKSTGRKKKVRWEKKGFGR